MKKRLISLFRILDHADRQKVLDWIQIIHVRDIMDTGHFDKVLVFPSDGEPDMVTIIAIAKSVEDCDQYEAENLPPIRSSLVTELIKPHRVDMIAGYSCTEKAA